MKEMTASAANRRLAARVMAWAWDLGLRVTMAQVLRDLPAWATAYNTITAPDYVITLGEAATRLGIKEASAGRYLRAGKIARRGGGVSARSVETYKITRAANVTRTRAVPGWRGEGRRAA